MIHTSIFNSSVIICAPELVLNAKLVQYVNGTNAQGKIIYNTQTPGQCIWNPY